MTFKSVRHLAGFTIKPLLGVMFVLRAVLPAAPAGAIVGGRAFCAPRLANAYP